MNEPSQKKRGMVKKRKSPERREEIVQAALRVVVRHGAAGLSVARVARQVGLSPSGIYRHFDGMDAVPSAVLDFIEARLHGHVDAVRARSAGAFDRLHALLRRHVRLIRENEAIPRIVFSEQVCSGKPDHRARLRRLIQGYLERVGDLIREGRAAGEIRAEVAPETAAMMFLGLIQPAAVFWHVSEGRFDGTGSAERGWDVYRRGLTPSAGGCE